MPKSADHFSIPLAEAAAVGHVNAGIHMYNNLKNHMEQSGEHGSKPDLQYLFQNILPAVSNLSLGLEIFLKVHKYQHTRVYSHGHDIEKLGLDFPESSLENLRREYLYCGTMPEFEPSLTFKMARGPNFKSSTAGEDPATYDEAIHVVGTMFTKWRYIYEHFGKDDVSETISFKPLGVLIAAVRTCIRSFKGGAVLRVRIDGDELAAEVGPSER